MRAVLILEDKPERRAEFERIAPTLGQDFELLFWDDAKRMQHECERYLPHAALISLEHDLNTPPGASADADPGSGLEVAKFLAEKTPVCPVIVHTANTDRSFSIINELRFAEWRVDRVGPIGDRWIEKYWRPKAQQMLTE